MKTKIRQEWKLRLEKNEKLEIYHMQLNIWELGGHKVVPTNSPSNLVEKRHNESGQWEIMTKNLCIRLWDEKNSFLIILQFV